MKLYIFEENVDETETWGEQVLPIFPLASFDLNELRVAVKKYLAKEAVVVCRRRFGAVQCIHTGEVYGWIRKVGKVV